MSEKSYVSVEIHLCPICTKKHHTGVLLDKSLRKSLDRETVTGWGICSDCQAKLDQDYIALVAGEMSKSEVLPNGNVKPDGIYRTGEIVWVKKDAADKIFNVPVNPPFVWIDQEAVLKIMSMLGQDLTKEKEGGADESIQQNTETEGEGGGKG